MQQFKLNFSHLFCTASLAVVMLLSPGFRLPEPKATPGEITCPSPEVVLSFSSSGALIFNWPDNGASFTTIEFVNVKDHSIAGSQTVTGTSVTLSGLPAGTYNVQLRCSCSIGSYSDYIIFEDLVLI